MAFTASTCLTDLGGITLTDPIKFYSDVNNFLFEFGSENLSGLTGSSCPYILENIPDGTKVVKIVSENNYCVNLDVEKLDCDYFNFQLIRDNSISAIKTAVFSLKASNINLSDYSIAWYGPDNKNNLVFTSGKGSFTYDFTDPINQPVEGGTYYPVVQNVKFKGKTFSNTGGTGQIYADLEDCLPPQVIQPCNCQNRTAQPFDKYNHSYEYVSESNTTPVPVSVSLTLTAGTKYVGWSFKGNKIPDRLTIYFKGSAYPMQIGLDDWIIGGDVPNNPLNLNNFPKSAKTQEFISKIISLEKFTVNNNDKIIFNITPNSNQTDWDLKYTCLTDKECQSCLFDQNNYKIPKSSITVTYDSGKCQTDIVYKVINNCQVNNRFFEFNNFNNVLQPYNIPPTNSSLTYNNSLFFSKLICTVVNYGYLDNQNKTCGNPIKFTRSNNGTVNFYTFSGDPIDINFYYNQLITSIQNYSGITTSDNTKPDYYNSITINIPRSTSTSCENLLIDVSIIPVSSTIVKSIDNKTLTITPNILTYNPSVLTTLSSSTCSNCEVFLKDQIDEVNLYSTPNNGIYPSYSVTIANGRPKDLVYAFNKIDYGVSTFTSRTESGYIYYSPSLLDTIPFSGSNVIIPSLSASTCQLLKCGYFNNTTQIGQNQKYFYTTELLNPLDNTAFKITTNVIQNCEVTTNKIDIYVSSGGTVSIDPNYII